VLEFARSINVEAFDKAFSKIKWTQNDRIMAWIDVVSSIPIPWFPVLKNFNHFLKTTPAKRTFELQVILKSLLDKVKTKRDIYIVVEDIDRSGDAGIFFLETLNYFIKNNLISEKIKNNPSSQKITVLVAIWSEQRTLNLNSYLKCLDYSREFNLEWVECNKLVDNLFRDELFEEKDHEKWQIQSFFEWYFSRFSDQVTMRILKKCLREANLSYAQNLNLDYRIFILVEIAKCTKTPHPNIKDRTYSYLEKRKSEKIISASDSIFFAFLSAIYLKKNKICDVSWELLQIRNPIKIDTSGAETTDPINKSPLDDNFYISKVYFN